MFDWHFWCLFCLLFMGIRHLPHMLPVPPTKACLLCITPTGMDLYTQVHAWMHLPSAVPWVSEDRLFWLDYGLKRVLLFTQILFQKCIGHHLSPAPRIWRTSQSGKKCMWFVSIPQLNPKIHPVSGEKVARATNSPHPYVLSNKQVQC